MKGKLMSFFLVVFFIKFACAKVPAYSAYFGVLEIGGIIVLLVVAIWVINALGKYLRGTKRKGKLKRLKMYYEKERIKDANLRRVRDIEAGIA